MRNAVRAFIAAIGLLSLAACGNAYESVSLGDWYAVGSANAAPDPESTVGLEVTSRVQGQGAPIKPGELVRVRIAIQEGRLDSGSIPPRLVPAGHEVWLWTGRDPSVAGNYDEFMRWGSPGSGRLRKTLIGQAVGARYEVKLARDSDYFVEIPLRGFTVHDAATGAGSVAATQWPEVHFAKANAVLDVEVLEACPARLYRRADEVHQVGYILNMFDMHYERVRHGTLTWSALEAQCPAPTGKVRLEIGPLYFSRGGGLYYWTDTYRGLSAKASQWQILGMRFGSGPSARAMYDKPAGAIPSVLISDKAERAARKREEEDLRALSRASPAEQRTGAVEYAINRGVMDQATCEQGGAAAFTEACKEQARRNAASAPPAPSAPDPASGFQASGTEVLTIKAHAKSIAQIVTSANGRWFASAGLDGIVKVWNAQTGAEARSFPAGKASYSVAFSPNSRIIAIGQEDGALILRSLETGAEQGRFALDTAVMSIAFSSDGRLIAAGGYPQVMVWESASRRERLRVEHGYIVTSLVFMPDGRTLLGGDADGYVRTWNLADGAELLRISGSKKGYGRTLLSPDGRLIVHGGGFGIDIWDTAERRDVRRLHGPNHWALGLAFLPDGKTLATAGGGDKTIRLWDATTGQMTALVGSHKEQMTTLAPARNGKSLIVGSDDGLIKIWKLPAS